MSDNHEIVYIHCPACEGMIKLTPIAMDFDAWNNKPDTDRMPCTRQGPDRVNVMDLDALKQFKYIKLVSCVCADCSIRDIVMHAGAHQGPNSRLINMNEVRYKRDHPQNTVRSMQGNTFIFDSRYVIRVRDLITRCKEKSNYSSMVEQISKPYDKHKTHILDVDTVESAERFGFTAYEVDGMYVANP